jgi:hypothetical protein
LQFDAGQWIAADLIPAFFNSKNDAKDGGKQNTRTGENG